MATITPTKSYTERWVIWEWTPVTEADVASAAELTHRPADIILQVSGTFGAATIKASGSLDDTTYQGDLEDPGGTAIAITAAGGKAIRDAWRYIKPTWSGGTGQSNTIKLIARL